MKHRIPHQSPEQNAEQSPELPAVEKRHAEEQENNSYFE